MITVSAILSVIIVLLSTFLFVNIVYKDFLKREKQRNLLLDTLKNQIQNYEIDLQKKIQEKKGIAQDLVVLKHQRNQLISQEEQKLKQIKLELNITSEKLLQHKRESFGKSFQVLLDDSIESAVLQNIGGL